MTERLTVETRGPEGQQPTAIFDAGAQVWIGRDPTCDLVLLSASVSRKHARVTLHRGQLVVTDSSANGTTVDGHEVCHEQHSAGPPCEIAIGPYTLRIAVRTLQSAAPPTSEAFLRKRIRGLLMDALDLPRLDLEHHDRAKLERRVRTGLADICDRLAVLPGDNRDNLIDELCDEVLGLGPLEALLGDPAVSEIMVVDPSTIYLERSGKLERSDRSFTDDDAVRAALERIVTPLGRRIDESSPLVDARLADGSRVNAVIPPLATRGPCITIRKFSEQRWDLTRLVECGSLTVAMAELLDCAVRCRQNIVVSGGTGSGKTTLLNALSAAIPEEERVVTIEDAAELKLQQEHVVTLEARPANMEGQGAFSVRDLLKNALRMRPDRIIVGECRGGEALDMLQAMNTGHEGSMTTTHANSPLEATARLETLALMAGLDLPARAIRQQIAASIHLLVQQVRLPDGRRLVTHISEVTGIDDQGQVGVHDIYRYKRTGLTPDGRAAGRIVSTGYLPACLGVFHAQGALDRKGAP